MKASLVRLCLGFSCSETLAGVCKQLKCHWKECERLLSDIIGMGHVMHRTELISHSTQVYREVKWLSRALLMCFPWATSQSGSNY